MSDDIVRSGPPPEPGTHRYDALWARVASECRSTPGQWVNFVFTGTEAAARTTAPAIRRGRIRQFEPAGAYEAACRKVNAEMRIYVRYVGEETAP